MACWTDRFVDSLEDFGEPRYDQRELVLADLNETLFVLLDHLSGVRSLRPRPVWQLWNRIVIDYGLIVRVVPKLSQFSLLHVGPFLNENWLTWRKYSGSIYQHGL